MRFSLNHKISYKRLIAIFLSILMTFSLSYADQSFNDVETFDLKKSIEFAIQSSPSFDSIRRQVSVAQLEEKSAKARFLPSLDLTTTHGIQDTSPRSTTSAWNSDFNLGLTGSLYDNGVTLTSSKIASLNRKYAELKFRDQKNKISLDIASQFLVYSLDVKLMEIQERQFKLIGRQFDSISKGYYQGLKTKDAFLRFKTQVIRGEINLVTAKSSVEKSKQELQRLVGGPLSSNRQVEFVPISLDSIKNDLSDISLKIEEHLQYQAAQVQKQINQLNVDLVDRKNFPEFYLTTGINYTSSNYLETGESFADNAQTGWNALLTVKYNFFDWGIRSRDKDITLQRSLIQSNELDSSLLILKSELGQLSINVGQIRKNYALAKELLALEKDNISFIQREFRNGKVYYLDLISGLNNISEAEIKFYSAVSDLQAAKYTQLYHQGKIYDELLK